jgi:hypothetical protein
MNAQRPVPKVHVSEKSWKTRKPNNNSYESRILEKSISDDHILSFVEIYFRSRTMGLIRKDDEVKKRWLDVNNNGDIVVKFLLRGPPMKINKKGVKITIINA